MREAKLALLEAQVEQAQNDVLADSLNTLKEMLEAQKELINLQNEINGNVGINEKFQELYLSYTTKAAELVEFKYDLYDQQQKLTYYLNDSAGLYTSNKPLIAEQQKNITDWQNQIAALEAYTGKDKADLQADYNRLTQEYDNANADLLLKTQTATDAKTAWDNLFNTKYNIDNINAGTHRYLAALAELQIYGLSGIYIEDYTTFSDPRLEYYAGTSELPATLGSYRILLFAYESELIQIKYDLNNDLKSDEELLGVPSSGSGETAVAATGLHKQLEDAEALLKAAIGADPMDESEVDRLQSEVNDLKALVNYYTVIIERKKDEIKEFDALTAQVTGENKEAYFAEAKALGESTEVKTYFDALVPLQASQNTYDNISAERNIIGGYLSSFSDLPDVQAEIAELEANIANAEAYIAELENNLYDRHLAIQIIRNEISRLTEQISILEECVAIAKKAIDEYIAAM
ncbi:MAG TPA: hypothetical protein IAC04_06815 [Candidatus Coprenecus stercoravium]|uniref:Uncharacterized protein n=1 Tax=Candidatus Coprenecus stercoravium TaxID=2840735 RepID=A0A9D2GS12_9BACT|nr:hypothetical protein [Candidatus Coprenecus stercoravium]